MRVWLIIGLLAVGLNQAVPKQADKSHANQDSGKYISGQSPKSATESPVPLARPSPTKKEDSANSEAKQANWREKLLSPIVSNWPLIAVAIWGILVARRTLRAIARQALSMRRQTTILRKSVIVARRNAKAAQASAEAAKASADAVINSERAWLLVEKLDGEYLVPIEKQTMRKAAAYPVLKNYGKTVAKMTAWKMELQICDSSERPDVSAYALSELNFAPSIVPPGEPIP